MNRDDLVASIMGVLKVGKDNAISFKDLHNKSNLKIGQMALALQYSNEEFCIIKDENGYYLPESVEEAKKHYYDKCNYKKIESYKLKGFRDYIRSEIA